MATQSSMTATDFDTDFELDVSFIPRGTAIAELMNSTSDGCGQTNQSACVTCISN